MVAIAYLLIVSPPAVDELRHWHGGFGPALFIFLCIGTVAVPCSSTSG